MMDESSAEWLQSTGLLCGDGPGLTTFRSSVLIFRCNRHLDDDRFKQLRDDIVQQVKEGVVVLPSYVDVFKPMPIEITEGEK